MQIASVRHTNAATTIQAWARGYQAHLTRNQMRADLNVHPVQKAALLSLTPNGVRVAAQLSLESHTQKPNPETLSRNRVTDILKDTYPKLTHGKSDIPLSSHLKVVQSYMSSDITPSKMEAICKAFAAHLTALGALKTVSSLFENKGRFFDYFKANANESNQKKIQALVASCLDYFHILSTLPPNDRSIYLAQFPDPNGVLACLEGSIERVEGLITSIRQGRISVEENTVFKTHESAVSTWLQKIILPVLSFGWHIHAKGALQIVLGVGSNEEFARGVAIAIPPYAIWDMLRSQAPTMNTLFSELDSTIDPTKINPFIKEVASAFDEGNMAKGSLKKFDVLLDTIGITEDEKNSLIVDSTKSGQEYMIDENGLRKLLLSRQDMLVKLGAVSHLHFQMPISGLPIPESLFSAEAPAQIAALFNSNNSYESDLAIEALKTIGVSRIDTYLRKNTSPIQFLKIAESITGKQGEQALEALKDRLSHLKDLSPLASSSVQSICDEIDRYRDPANSIMGHYLTLPKKTPERILFLLENNAPLYVIQEELQGCSIDLGSVLSESSLFRYEALVSNPNVVEILDCVIRAHTTPRDLVIINTDGYNPIISFLALSIEFHNSVKAIEYMLNGFKLQQTDPSILAPTDDIRPSISFSLLGVAADGYAQPLLTLAIRNPQSLFALLHPENAPQTNKLDPNILITECTSAVSILMKLVADERFHSLSVALIFLNNGPEKTQLATHLLDFHAQSLSLNVNMVKLLLELGAVADVNLLFVKAIETGNEALVKFLLSTRRDQIDSDRPDSRGLLPIDLALMVGDVAIVELVLDSGVSNVDINKLLARAIYEGFIPVAELLLKRGATIAEASRHRSSSFIFDLNNRADVAAWLVDKGEPIDGVNTFGETPLMVAIGSVQPEVAMFLISRGADVNKPDFSGSTPLHEAAGLCAVSRNDGLKPVVELLLQKGADMNKPNNEGKTPLDYAKRWCKTLFLSFSASKVVSAETA